MARRRGKYFNLWLMLILASLYFPFQEFLKAQEYATAEQFFEDLLGWVIVGSFFAVPLLLLIVWRRRKRKRAQNVLNGNDARKYSRHRRR